MCKVCGGDHWTKDHGMKLTNIVIHSVDDRGQHWVRLGLADFDRLAKIAEVATDISRRTYVDEGVVAHVPYDTLYALRQALFGSDDEIVAALDRLER
jgi:hypothetical protein